jgi:DNA-binding NarL/FixJ family response regulator
MLASTMACWDQAEAHFATALTMNERIGGVTALAHTRYDFALMLLARAAPGDRDKAIELIREAQANATGFGLAALSRKAAVRLTEVSRAPVAAPDDLTARELEVLRLLAIGRGNADIAMVLEISLNTVATHVRNILGKTGCANRTEAAAYAMRHGLHPDG